VGVTDVLELELPELVLLAQAAASKTSAARKANIRKDKAFILSPLLLITAHQLEQALRAKGPCD
jgi:hypothetical protein